MRTAGSRRNICEDVCALARLEALVGKPPGVLFSTVNLFETDNLFRKSMSDSVRLRRFVGKMVRIGSFIGLLTGCALNVQAQNTNLPDYFMRVWQTQDGLPNNAVTAIVQTHDGYLWLATYDGLVRFDGVTFTVFDNSNTPQMHSSRITSLFEDATDNLWIGCESGDLIRYRNGHFDSVPFHPQWENKKILSIGANAAGQIRLMNGDGKLADLDSKTVVVPTVSGAVTVIMMASSPGGSIWVDWSGRIFNCDQDRPEPLPFGQSPDDFAKGICASRDGGLWIVTQDRVLRWNDNRIDDLGPSPLGQSSIITMMETKSGCLAVGTLEQVLFLILPHRGAVHFKRARNFPSNWVRTLCEDREGP